MRAARILLAVVLVLAGARCTNATPPTGPVVVTTTSLLADVAANVAGNDAAVMALVPPGVPVEDFVPTPSDAIAIARATVIFLNGSGLDRWIEPLLADARADAAIVTLSDGLPSTSSGAENPHYFLDVSYTLTYVARMRDALAAADPAHADAYRARAASYGDRLRSLDAEIRAAVATIPAERRVLVTSHDAFPYFAAAYGFTLVGFVQGESGKEPSPTELAALVKKVRAARAPAIFAERALSPRLATTLAGEAGVATVVTDLLTDSLGPPPEDSYVALMRFDTTRIVEALR